MGSDSMSWIALALLSALVFAGVMVMDKVFVSRYFSDAFVYSLFIRGFALVSAVIIAVTVGALGALAFPAMGWALGSGLVQILGWGFYFKAIAQTDAAWVAAFGQSRPVVTALLGFLVLGELLRPAHYLGIAAITLGMIALSLERSVRNVSSWQSSSVVGLMIISVLANGLVSLFARIGLENEDPSNVFLWQQLGGAIGASILFGVWSAGRSSLRAMLSPLPLWVYLTSFGVELCAAIGGALMVTALARGPLGSVTALSAIKPLFVLVISFACNAVRPGIVETKQRQPVLPRWLIVLTIVGGVYLLGR